LGSFLAPWLLSGCAGACGVSGSSITTVERSRRHPYCGWGRPLLGGVVPLGPAVAVAAVPVFVAVSTVPAGQPAPVLPTFGQQFQPPDGWAGGWAPGEVEPHLPCLGWHGMVSGTARYGLKSFQNASHGMCDWAALPPHSRDPRTWAEVEPTVRVAYGSSPCRLSLPPGTRGAFPSLPCGSATAGPAVHHEPCP